MIFKRASYHRQVFEDFQEMMTVACSTTINMCELPC